MSKALYEVDGFADKVEQFGMLLNGKQVRDLASSLFELIRSEDNIVEAARYNGFSQLWRLSLKKTFDSHKTWITDEIRKALSVSLRFANDLYQYWRHESDYISGAFPTPELREMVVKAAREAYGTDPRVYIGALDVEYAWSTYHLVVLHSSQQRGGPGLDNEDWSWFGAILLLGGSMEPEVVIPQIAILLTDYEHEPGRRGGTVHKCVFNDSIAQQVFGPARMRELMTTLEKDFQQRAHDVEISARIACCQGWARERLRENRKKGSTSAP